MVNDRAFIFHIYIPWGKTLSLVPKSRSSVKVKVKYQGHSFRKKNEGGGIRVSQTHVVYLCISFIHYFKGVTLLAIHQSTKWPSRPTSKQIFIIEDAFKHKSRHSA